MLAADAVCRAERKMTVLRFLFLIAVACITWSAQAAEERQAIKLDIPVLPEMSRYRDLLAYPPILALALENVGLNPSLSSRIILKDRRRVEISSGFARFVRQQGQVYHYEAGTKLSFGVGASDLTIPVELDVAQLDSGRLTLRIYPPLAKLFPKELIDRVEFKVRAIANLNAQRTLIKYLDGVAAATGKGQSIEAMFEPILFDAYNRSSSVVVRAGDRGDAEALSDQIVLLITLAVWLIGFPVFLFFVRMRRKRAQPS